MTNAAMKLMASAAARRRAQPPQNQQRQINEPETNGPDHLRVRPIRRVRRARQMPSGSQPHRQKDESCEYQPDGDDFQTLDGREQRQHGAQLVEFQIMLLHQKHGRRHRAQTKRAVGQQNRRGVQADQRAGKFRWRARGCGGSSAGISANTPMASSTGDANAPRNRSLGSRPMTRYAATIVHATNVVAS